MQAHFVDLYNARALVLIWVWREIKVRYKQSVLGMGWAIAQPLATTIVYAIVFTRFVRVPTEGIPYPIFAYTALVPWTFFASSLSTGIPSLVHNMGLLTKIYFPREILPFAAVMARAIDFLFAALVLIGLMVFYRVPLHFTIIWLPLLLIIQLLLTLGIVLLGSAINVAYRDVGQVIPLMTQLWLYASPVIYPVSLVPEQFRTLYWLNPMAGLLDGYRRVLLQGKPPDGFGVVAAFTVSLLAFVVGYTYFKRVEAEFADII
jgi:lipopolysaccharide transport system permease protein